MPLLVQPTAVLIAAVALELAVWANDKPVAKIARTIVPAIVRANDVRVVTVSFMKTPLTSDLCAGYLRKWLEKR
jgi:hypothetical protein